MGALWNPFAVMADVDGRQVVMVRGEGVLVFDERGRAFVDAAAGLWFCHIGYGRQEMADAIAEQTRRLHAFHLFGEFANQPVQALAERLARLAPFRGGRVFFTSGGSESIDSAAKLVRRYFHEIGQPGRTVLLSRTHAYHGVDGIGTSLGGIDANRLGYGELIGDTVRVPWDSIDSLAHAIEQVGPSRVAAFFAEPVLGAGGVRFPPARYLEEAARLVREAGGLFVVDEVITGFGRMGEWFGSLRLELRPDIVTFAKGVTSGYVPLGGVIISPEVAAPFWDPQRRASWRHGYTYSGHAAAAAAALINLDIIEREGLLRQSREIEAALHVEIGPLVDHPLVSEVRLGPGAMAGVQVDPSSYRRDPDVMVTICAGAMDHGAIVRPLYGGTIQISPPLIAGREDVARIGAAVRAGLDRATSATESAEGPLLGPGGQR